MRTEDLGETLHLTASYLDEWLNLVPRDVYPMGAGLVRSSFTVGRSFPTSDEETWEPITTTSGETYVGSCGDDFPAVDTGYKERFYSPEKKSLSSNLQCVDDFTLHWNSAAFWTAYMAALEKRNKYSITNRLANMYMNLVPKAAANDDFHWIDGYEPPGPTSFTLPSSVDLSGLDISNCPLDQWMLDRTALELLRSGAPQGDSNGWITTLDGFIFTLLIGVEASDNLWTNNADFRQDYRFAFEGWGNAAPLLQRIGAKRIIRDFRHLKTLTPPRWKVVNGAYVRVPTYVMSADTKGFSGEYNPDYLDPLIATHEGAIVLNPQVYTERILQPETALAGMNWGPQNYFGEWKFVTGPSATIGFADCPTLAADPFETHGRFVARYRHAAEPVHPEFGRLIVFARCQENPTCASCS